jgi:hypothetical protein
MDTLTTQMDKLVLDTKCESKTSFSKKSKVTMETIPYIPWTDKSKDVAYKSSIVGIGHGEYRVAAEFGTTPLGQNSPYDMDITIDGISMKADVKQLDKKTFNTGVEGRNYLRPIKNNINNLLELLPKIVATLDFTNEQKKEFNALQKDGVSPDEFSAGSVKALRIVCTILNNKQKELRAMLPIVKPLVDPYTSSTIEMTVESYHKLFTDLNFPFPEELKPYNNHLHILSVLNHPYINDPTKLDKDLQSLVGIFHDVVLIFVDEEKGYYILKEIEGNIKFERITRGHPRFRACI